MRYFNFILIILFSLTHSKPLVAQRLWVHKCLTCVSDQQDFLTDKDDNIYVLAGHFFNTTYPSYTDIVKISKNGVERWNKQLSLNTRDYVITKAIIDSNFLIAVGSTFADTNKFFIAKVNLNTGQTVSFTTMPITRLEHGSQFFIAKDQLGNYNIKYDTVDSVFTSFYRFVLLKFDRNLQFIKRYNEPKRNQEFTVSGLFTKDGSFVYARAGYPNSFMVKLKPNWVDTAWILKFPYTYSCGLGAQNMIETDENHLFYLFQENLKTKIVKIVPQGDSASVAWTRQTDIKAGRILYNNKFRRFYIAGEYTNTNSQVVTLAAELNPVNSNIIWSEALRTTDSANIAFRNAALSNDGELFLAGGAYEIAGRSSLHIHWAFGYYKNHHLTRLGSYTGSGSTDVNETAGPIAFLSDNTVIINGSAYERDPINSRTTLAYAYPFTTAIKEIQQKINWQISPNPAHEQITINIPELTSVFQMQIVDGLGKIVLNSLLDKTMTTVSTHNLPAGIYVIKIIDSNHHVDYKKLILY